MNKKKSKILLMLIFIVFIVCTIAIFQNQYFMKESLTNNNLYKSDKYKELLRADIVKKGIFPISNDILYYDVYVEDETKFSIDDSQQLIYNISSQAIKDYNISKIKYHVYKDKSKYVKTNEQPSNWIDEFTIDLKKDKMGTYSRTIKNGTIKNLSKEALTNKTNQLENKFPLYDVYKINKLDNDLNLELYTIPSYNYVLNNYGADTMYLLSNEILEYNKLKCNVNIKMYLSTFEDIPGDKNMEDSSYWSYSLKEPEIIRFNSKLIVANSNILNTTGEVNELNKLTQEELNNSITE